jgi:hypothetical protein
LKPICQELKIELHALYDHKKILQFSEGK